MAGIALSRVGEGKKKKRDYSMDGNTGGRDVTSPRRTRFEDVGAKAKERKAIFRPGRKNVKGCA